MAKPKQTVVNMGLSNFMDYATLAFKAVEEKYQDLDIPEVKVKETRPKLSFPYTKYKEPTSPEKPISPFEGVR